MPAKAILIPYSLFRFLFPLIIVFSPGIINSQICSGSFGDPVVNITFGQIGAPQGTNFVPSSSYKYQTVDCPDDGFYTVTNATSNCFGNTWYTVSKDHTGGGNFMLVNASFDPGDFFLTSVTDLCPNTTYEFSSWVMNVITRFNSILPNITFRIEQPDGTVLARYDTGDIPVTAGPEWKQYGFIFTTPPTNAVIVLRMTNNAPGGIGNDIALDDITFRPCGATIIAGIQNNPTDTVNVCEGDRTNYTFSGSASSAFQTPVNRWQLSTDLGKTWNDIAGATTLTYLRFSTPAPGNYWYRLTVVDSTVAGVPSCRIASNVLVINVHPKPVADAGPDRIYIKGYPVTLSAIASGENVSFNWSPTSFMDDPSLIDPTIIPRNDIMYKLFVQSAFDCTNEDSVKVSVVEGIYVPTAFTPNNDGKNDYWRIPFLDTGLEADVKIFNRWGQLVYHVASATVSWDGKMNGRPQASGTYVYIVTFKNNKLPEMKGTFTLIR